MGAPCLRDLSIERIDCEIKSGSGLDTSLSPQLSAGSQRLKVGLGKLGYIHAQYC